MSTIDGRLNMVVFNRELLIQLTQIVHFQGNRSKWALYYKTLQHTSLNHKNKLRGVTESHHFQTKGFLRKGVG